MFTVWAILPIADRRQRYCLERGGEEDHGSKIRGSDRGTFAGAGVSLDYLVGNSEVLLDKDLIKRITEIQQLSEADRQGIFFALDGLLRDAKARKAYA